MQQAMESGAGIYRDEAGLRVSADKIAELKRRFDDVDVGDRSLTFNTALASCLELENMLDVAEAVAVTAAARKESRGAHACRDYPTRNDEQYLHHSLVYLEPADPRVDKKDVTLGRWEPVERKY